MKEKVYEQKNRTDLFYSYIFKKTKNEIKHFV